jgi:RNA recognition motif-containing protein
MGKKLYVGNVPFQATEQELTEFFAKIGEVESAKIIVNMQTGQSRGFGFVEMVSQEDANKAISDLNGTTFMDKNIVVNEAKPQKPRERGGGGFGRGRGTRHQRGHR